MPLKLLNLKSDFLTVNHTSPLQRMTSLCMCFCGYRRWGMFWMVALGILTLLGCGLSSEKKDGQSGQSQKFIGFFVDADGQTPVQGLSVTLTNTGDSSFTDSEGRCEITASQAISGEAELLVSAPSWGETHVRIVDVPAGTTIVAYQAVVNTRTRTIEITDLMLDGSEDPVVTPAPVPVGTPTVSVRPIATATPSHVVGQGTPTKRPTAPVTKVPTAAPKPTKKPGGGTPANCLICHGDRGSPRCGDSSWEAIHRVVYTCKGNKADLPEDVSSRDSAFSLVQSLKRATLP